MKDRSLSLTSAFGCDRRKSHENAAILSIITTSYVYWQKYSPPGPSIPTAACLR
jgi:hypothetical protein